MGMSVDEALAGIDGWEGARATELSGGLNNRTWRVDKGGRSAVLKIDAAPRGEPYNSRPAEALIQQLAHEAGLANRVLFVNETVYMTEYADGVVWSLDCLDDDANIEQLAARPGSATACRRSPPRRGHRIFACVITISSSRTSSMHRRRASSTGNTRVITIPFLTSQPWRHITGCRSRSAARCWTLTSTATVSAGRRNSNGRPKFTMPCSISGSVRNVVRTNDRG